MNSNDALGLIAGVLTTISFLPQVIKTWRSRSAKDLSLGMFGMFSAGIFLWLYLWLESKQHSDYGCKFSYADSMFGTALF
jgi:MtN3 and saliva related transmembrane protein